MPYCPPDHLHWCECSERAVFLDVQGDRYFCLPSGPSQTFLRVAAGGVPPDAHIGWLIGKGILVSTPTNKIRARASLQPATSDFPVRGSYRPRPLFVALTILAEIQATRDLRKRTFANVLENIVRPQSPKNSEHRDLTNTVSDIVAASNAVSLLFRATDRCLIRAIALYTVCRKRGINPKLVFGVRMHPFGAHCWVQLGTHILVGNFEQTRLYTPVLVME